jgi:glycosyltransferase involved in cell wall biosynthesis
MIASIIIPTYNGANKILNIIEALSIQTISNFEIIIGVDGSDDNTDSIIAKQKFINTDRITVFTQENKGRSIIRNNCAKIAKSELLVFYDDDMIPLKDSVEKHILFHNNRLNCVLGGSVIDKYENTKSDFLKYKEYLSRKWSSIYKKNNERLNRDNLFLTAANFSISKNLFFKLNGFDEHLTDAEDWDFVIRAYDKNIDVYFDATNIAWHNDRLTCKQYIFRQRDYNKNQLKLSELKPELYKKYSIRQQEPKQDIFRVIIYKLFANKLNVRLIDNNFFIFLPKRIRCKFYNIVITGLGKVFVNKDL